MRASVNLCSISSKTYQLNLRGAVYSSDFINSIIILFLLEYGAAFYGVSKSLRALASKLQVRVLFSNDFRL